MVTETKGNDTITLAVGGAIRKDKRVIGGYQKLRIPGYEFRLFGGPKMHSHYKRDIPRMVTAYLQDKANSVTDKSDDLASAGP